MLFFRVPRQAALSKQEVENLLRHGAYDILNEAKAGTAEAESREFVEQDIDSILQRHSRKVVHDNTGSQSNAAGSTFSKASFKASKSPGAGSKGGGAAEDVDIEDPDFWKKMLGDVVEKKGPDDVTQRRRRTKMTNYNEDNLARYLDATLGEESGSSSNEGEDEDDVDDSVERMRWGGSALKNEWKKDDADAVAKALLTFGYGRWDDLLKLLGFGDDAYSSEEVRAVGHSCGMRHVNHKN